MRDSLETVKQLRISGKARGPPRLDTLPTEAVAMLEETKVKITQPALEGVAKGARLAKSNSGAAGVGLFERLKLARVEAKLELELMNMEKEIVEKPTTALLTGVGAYYYEDVDCDSVYLIF